jgi:hypothetical protein
VIVASGIAMQYGAYREEPGLGGAFLVEALATIARAGYIGGMLFHPERRPR